MVATPDTRASDGGLPFTDHLRFNMLSKTGPANIMAITCPIVPAMIVLFMVPNLLCGPVASSFEANGARVACPGCHVNRCRIHTAKCRLMLSYS
mmetsp:Transcript_125096/g.221702  ORF Transcript_125096/g.221702 Transcript_125096/m.221702 type:complete len:94 (-) Transcript_125096:37-318(-)